METMDEIKKFIDYIIDEEDDDYNPDLPFGGIVSDAPEEAKKEYERYVLLHEKYKKMHLKV